MAQREVITFEFRADGARVVKTEVEDIGKAAHESSSPVGELKLLLAELGVAVGLAEVVREFASLDQALNRVRVISGASAAEFGRLKEAAQDVGSSTQFSVLEASQALGQLSRSGQTAEVAIAKLRAATDLATVGATSLSAGAEALTSVMRSFNVQGDQAAHVSDVLSLATQGTAISVGELASVLHRVGPDALTAGHSFEEVAADLVFLVNSGIDGRKAISGLTEVLKPGAGATGEFGREARIVFDKLRDGKADVERLKDEFTAAEGASNKLANELRANLVDQAKTLKNTIADLIQTFADLFTSFGLTATNLGKVNEALKQFKSEVDSIKGDSSDFSIIDKLLYGKGSLASRESDLSTAQLKKINDQRELTKKLKEENDRELVTNRTGPQVTTEPGGFGFAGPTVSAEDLDKLQKAADAQRALEKSIASANATLVSFNNTLNDHVVLSGLSSRAEEIESQVLQARDILVKNGLANDKEALRVAEETVRSKAKQIQQLQEQRTFEESILAPREEAIRQQDYLNILYRDGKISLDQYNLSFAELYAKTVQANDAFGGFKSTLLSVDTSARAIGQSLGTTLTGAIDRASGALADFAISGFRNVEDLKKALSSLLADIAKQIVQIIIQTLILKTIQAGLNGGFGLGGGTSVGGGTGNSLTNSGGDLVLTQHAGGGDVRGGRPIIVGERGPEIWTPPADGSIIPNGGALGQPAAPPVVNVTVVNVTNPDEVISAMNSAEGEKVILNHIQKNPELIRRVSSS